MRPALVLLCVGLLGCLAPSAAVPLGRMIPAYQQRGERFAPPAEYDEAEYDDDFYNDDEYAAYDPQYRAPVPPARRRRNRRDMLLEMSARAQQPAGIDRDDNGVVGDFDGENGAPEGGAPVASAEGGAQLMTPAGEVVSEEPAAAAEGGAQETVEVETAPSAPTTADGEEPDKLTLALGAIKEDIMKKSRQVGEELTWNSEVSKVMESYQAKQVRVQANIEKLRGEVKELYKKKKQIENLILQKQLQEKLTNASEDMDTLDKALGHVKSKEDEFTKTRTNIQDTIDGIEAQLKKLEGKTDEEFDAADEESTIEEDIKSEI